MSRSFEVSDIVAYFLALPIVIITIWLSAGGPGADAVPSYFRSVLILLAAISVIAYIYLSRAGKAGPSGGEEAESKRRSKRKGKGNRS